MKMQHFFLAAILFLCSSCSDKIIRIVKTKPFVAEWQFSPATSDAWQPAIVPGIIQMDLLRAGKIEQPLFEDNEKKLQWISETEWKYKAKFSITDSLLKFKAVDLIFKGIDTYSTIFVNDSVVLTTDNMFREWRVDVKKYLREGENVLKVLLHAPALRGKEEMIKVPYRLPMGNDAGEIKVSSFVRKAPYHFGWDWAPRFLTMGIWKSISISGHDNVYINSIQLKTIEIADTCAWLSAFVTVHSKVELPNAVITVKEGFKQFAINKGINIAEIKFKIDNPLVWWPNGFGEQPLYDIVAKLYINGYLADTITGRTGIRTVELFQDEDEDGTGFYFRINGLPIFMKGANYVPQSNFLTEITDTQYVKLIDDVKSTNMNMLRVWGGGIYENDLFYNLCDEHGILIWQDFMFAGSMYPGDSSFTTNVYAEISQQVERLRNHPSLALWCGNNEIDVAWNNWGWQKEYSLPAADSSRIYSDYKIMFEDSIASILNRADGSRPYIPSSPISNWGKRENFGKGNMHYWGVWHGEESIDSFRVNVPRFMTEYGMQSYPSFQTLKKNTNDERITLNSEFISNRQRSYKGNKLLINYIERQFGAVQNAEELCYLSQLNQAEAMHIAIQSHRKDARYCMGSLYWQLNDVWDGASWSTIEHKGKWKAAHYRLKALYAKNILIVETINDATTVYLQSDNTDGQSGKLKIDILDFKGRSLGSYWSEAETRYLVASRVFQMPVKAMLKNKDKASFFLKVQLLNNDSLVATAIHYFVSPKELLLPASDIKYEIIPVSGGAEIRLNSLTLAKGVMLEFENAEGKFSDNYFDLLPGEEKVVRFEGNLGRDELIVKWYNKQK